MHELSRKQLLDRMRELEFAAVELNLFLDNHPADERALADFNMVTQELTYIKKTYEAQFGPLTNFGYAPSHYPWRWVEEPWPWESGE